MADQGLTKLGEGTEYRQQRFADNQLKSHRVCCGSSQPNSDHWRVLLLADQQDGAHFQHTDPKPSPVNRARPWPIDDMLPRIQLVQDQPKSAVVSTGDS
jgi:hypothetical protein